MNHNQNLPIKQMVFNRLPFLEDTPKNEEIISQFTLEVMYELEPCLRKRMGNDNIEDWSRVGDEDNYNVMERSVIADVVTMYILMMTFFATMGGNAGAGTPSLSTYLKKAKAGSTEVEYDQFDIKGAAMLALDSKSLLEQVKNDINRKARVIGCIFDVCNDCTIALGGVSPVPAFIVHTNMCR